MMLAIGIDTGGTCTDAVIYDFEKKQILAAAKAATTREKLEKGIANALDALPAGLLSRCGMAALSTTLATNACVENKGARARLLMLGFDWEMIERLKETYASYGLTDADSFVVMDARVEGYYSHPFDPDWAWLEQNAAAQFGDCDSIGIVQKHPRANGGRFELTALKLLRERLPHPITISFDISSETDILKTCAGTLLNARLIPLVTGFMDAVRHVMRDRGMDLPISIIRSDGTMIPEETARMYPVETILCGPAASVVGGAALAGEETALVVDMGGTTTDIALIRNGEPVLSGEGIRIGQWKTMVRGLDVETCGLGGDSAVRYRDGRLYLAGDRVMPVSALAAARPGVLPRLRSLTRERHTSIFPLHEFYVLLRDITDRPGWTEQEKRICSLLAGGPLIAGDLAAALGKYIGLINTQRLEAEGVLIRSGLTPTDMMILQGDFDLYDGEAAREALTFLSWQVSIPAERIPGLVYEMVTEKLYRAIGRMLLHRRFRGHPKLLEHDYLEELLGCSYRQAAALAGEAAGSRTPGGEKEALLRLTTDYPLIGVGAPVHVFLPRAAALLGTRAVIPEYAGVANALGAAASRRIARAHLRIRAVYEKAQYMGLELYEEGQRHFFESKEEAVAFGREVIGRMILKKAALYGLGEHPEVAVSVKENRFEDRPEGVLFEISLDASAR